MIASIILVTSVIVIYYLYYLTTKNLNYWENTNIPYIKPLPLVGNYGPYISLRKYIGEMTQSLCKEYPFAPYIGVYYGRNPTLLVQDPDVVKLILTKDFFYFSGRENAEFSEKETFLASLFFISGDLWKKVRQCVSPLFSSAKLKQMFDVMKNSVYSFEKTLHEEIGSRKSVKVRNLLLRFTLNSVGNCIFGVDTKTLEKDVQGNPYIKMSAMIFKISTIRTIKIVGRSVYPTFFYGLGLRDIPFAIDKFFKNFIIDLYKERSSIKSRGITDFLDKIKTAKMSVQDSTKNVKIDKANLVPDDNLSLAQCMTLFSAGFDSSATVILYTLYEIAKHPEVQDRVIHEIDEYLRRHDNKLEVDCVILELPYATACIDEAMRMYPIVPILRRQVAHSYTLPCGTVLDKGVRIHIPAYHFHHNPRYFPNPEEYRPERFLAENRDDIKPYSYLPFGEGPRMCIGVRFAKVQMILGLITILKGYRLKLAQEMPRNLDLVPVSIITQPKVDISLEFIEREGWQHQQFLR